MRKYTVTQTNSTIALPRRSLKPGDVLFEDRISAEENAMLQRLASRGLVKIEMLGTPKQENLKKILAYEPEDDVEPNPIDHLVESSPEPEPEVTPEPEPEVTPEPAPEPAPEQATEPESTQEPEQEESQAQVQEEEPEKAPQTYDPSLLDINSSSLKELTSVNGIGTSLARRIIAGRPYASLDDLTQINGVSQARVDEWRSLFINA